MRDAIEVHLGLVPVGDARAVRSTAYIWVDDAAEVAQAWHLAGADVRLPEDPDSGQHEVSSIRREYHPIRLADRTVGHVLSGDFTVRISPSW
jgi:hypothetical protein